MSCEQVEEFDVTLTSKDQEITQLKIQLAERAGQRVSSLPFTDNSTSDPLSSPTSRESRKGGAPPIGIFSDENPEVDKWLPSLQRAAHWNSWTEEEQLIQLAGHFKGQALAEWNLIIY